MTRARRAAFTALLSTAVAVTLWLAGLPAAAIACGVISLALWAVAGRSWRWRRFGGKKPRLDFTEKLALDGGMDLKGLMGRTPRVGGRR